MKYDQWLKEWLDSCVCISAKQRTAKRYGEIISKHVCPRLGGVELQKLTAIELQRFVTDLLISGNSATNEGLSSSTVNSIITVLKSSLTVALDLGLIQSNPASKLKRPKHTEKQVECFSPTEQKKIERAVAEKNKQPHLFGIVLCLYTGLRIGELLALEWKDLNLKNETLSVTKTCYDGKDKDGTFCRMADSPKTKSSQRTLPVPKQLLPKLKELKRTSDCRYVISKKGKPIFIRTYQRAFERLLKKLRIPRKRFHSLRHTFATRALECGMDVKTLAEILGHKNVTITLNRYAHSLIGHKKAMMNRLGKLFS